LKSLLELIFLFLFFAPSLEDLGVLMVFEEKITSSETSFQMASIYCDGRIFQNGVMHANMDRP
jgi:hypothetical protein